MMSPSNFCGGAPADSGHQSSLSRPVSPACRWFVAPLPACPLPSRQQGKPGRRTRCVWLFSLLSSRALTCLRETGRLASKDSWLPPSRDGPSPCNPAPIWVPTILSFGPILGSACARSLSNVAVLCVHAVVNPVTRLRSGGFYGPLPFLINWLEADTAQLRRRLAAGCID